MMVLLLPPPASGGPALLAGGAWTAGRGRNEANAAGPLQGWPDGQGWFQKRRKLQFHCHCPVSIPVCALPLPLPLYPDTVSTSPSPRRSLGSARRLDQILHKRRPRLSHSIAYSRPRC